MIEIADHASGAVLRVRAQPRARRARIVGVHAGALKVAVTEPPEKGRANEAIAELLASQFGVSRRQLTLLTGDTSKDKRFLVSGIRASELRARLERVISEAEQ
jgi:hypothetical protein